jgi:hypothetical protein
MMQLGRLVGDEECKLFELESTEGINNSKFFVLQLTIKTL